MPCVVEWRVPAGKKKKNWELHDARLIRTSDKEKELTKVMKELEDNCDTDSDDGKRVAKLPKRYEEDTVDEGLKPLSSKSVRLKASKSRAQELLAKVSDSCHQPSSVGETSQHAALKRRIHELEDENMRLKTIVTDNFPKLMNDVSLVLSCVQRHFGMSASSSTGASVAAPPCVDASPRQPQSEPVNMPENDKVALYPGSTVMVFRSAMSAIRQSSTATAMARMLLVAVFDVQTLLSSNMKGGASKRPGNDDGTRLQPLDEDKLEAIFRACMEKFPGTTRGVLGAAVNGKLTELRLKAKKL